MHIADGVLSLPVLLTGATLTVAGVTRGLKNLDYERIPQVAILSSTFFVASLIHLPIGPTSVHLVLNGLTGLLLGWAAFPALLIALFLQAVLFGFGGLSVLGVNTFNMALPAVLCYYLFNRLVITKTGTVAFVYGFVAGALAIVLSTVLIGLSLFVTSGAFLQVIQLTFLAHLPVMLTEGIITGSIVVFLHQVRPELLTVPLILSPQMEASNA
jgi:cobalt/nickel transport system permease protein